MEASSGAPAQEAASVVGKSLGRDVSRGRPAGRVIDAIDTPFIVVAAILVLGQSLLSGAIFLARPD